MKTLSQAQAAQVAGGAAPKDPALGLFPQTNIKIIDDIHRMEWKLYGNLLFGWMMKK